MPTIQVNKKELLRRLDKPENSSLDELADLFFEFGVECEDEENVDGEVIWHVEIGANRLDLLSLEGLSAALKLYVHPKVNHSLSLKDEQKVLNGLSKAGPVTFTIKKGCKDSYRPYAIGAVIRGIDVNDRVYATLINIQEKLHMNYCKERSLVAIGAHDLAHVTDKIKYEFVSVEDVKFHPLTQTKEMTFKEQVAVFSSNYLKSYIEMLADKQKVPLIMSDAGKDSKVLSMPPVINADHCKVVVGKTKDLFLDVTGTDSHKVNNVMLTILTTLSEYAESVEAVTFIDEEAAPSSVQIQTKRQPIAPEVCFVTEVSRFNSLLGTSKPVTAGEAVELLNRMQYRVSSGLGLAEETIAGSGPEKVKWWPSEEYCRARSASCVSAIPYVRRVDVMHSCDIGEDVAISYGLGRLQTEGKGRMAAWPIALRNKINIVMERTQNALISCGFKEVINFALTSYSHAFELMRWQEATSPILSAGDLGSPLYLPLGPAVCIGGSKTKQFQMLRASLIPGMLKLAANHQNRVLPLNLFEVGDVTVAASTPLNAKQRPATSFSDTAARTAKHMVAMTVNKDTAGLAELHGVLDCLLITLGLRPTDDYAQHLPPGAVSSSIYHIPNLRYTLRPVVDSEHPFSGSCLPGRLVEVVVVHEDRLDEPGTVIGILGTIHPLVSNQGFQVPFPISVFEVCIQGLKEWLSSEHLVCP